MSAQPRPDRERGVFETLLVVDGQPVELGAHLARLDASLRALFPGRTPPFELVEAIGGRAQGIALGGLRVTATPAADGEINAKIETARIPPERIMPAEPATIDAHSLVLPGGLGGHKWTDRAFLEVEEERLGADAVPVIFDRDGVLLEASRANAFAVAGHTLLTPPADGRILPGIARARALEVAVAAGLEVRETELRREDFVAADEVFLTGSLRGVERVRSLDGVPLKAGGEITARLAAGVRRAWICGTLDRVPRR